MRRLALDITARLATVGAMKRLATFLLMLPLLAACDTRYNEPVTRADAYTVYGMDPSNGLLSDLPLCRDIKLWDDVRSKYNGIERDYRTTGVLMDEVLDVQQAGAHVKYDGKVARGWCEGKALFSDQIVRRVVVELGSGQGFAGTDYSLSVCVDGLDRHKAYAPHCRALRRREF